MNHEITIFTDIDKDAFIRLEAQLAAIPEGEPILIKINSNGGSTVQGLAMHDIIKSRSGMITCLIMGMCASAATVIAAACDKIIMQPAATFMVHRPYGGLFGTVAEIEKSLVLFREMEAKFISIYADLTQKTEEEIEKLLDGDVYMNAAEALAGGWVDEIAGRADITPENAASSDIAANAKVTLPDYSEKSRSVWSLPELAAMAADIFRAPEEKAERKATEQLAAMQADFETLSKKAAAAEASAAAAREELDEMTRAIEAEKLELAEKIQLATAEAIKALGYAAMLPESESASPHEITEDEIREAGKRGGLSAALGLL